MPKNRFESCLVLGAGSIGFRHCKIAQSIFSNVVVMDPSEQARERVCEHFPEFVVKETIASALESLNPSSTLGIIANWGIDHCTTFDLLADFGIKAILCEKPFAHSAAAIWKMTNRSQKESIDLRINHHRRYAGVAEKIIEQFDAYGEVCEAVFIHGGAQCIVTNGIHWLDLACSVFNKTPLRVSALLNNSQLNPRSDKLGFWEGTAHWEFSGEKKCAISFTNHSSVSASIHFYSRNCRLDFVPGGATFFGKRNDDDIQKFPAVTRTGKIVSEYAFDDPSTFDATEIIIREMVEGEEPKIPITDHACITEALLMALKASALGKTIQLPVAKNSEEFFDEWSVS